MAEHETGWSSLSAAGRARREAMRGLLQREVRVRRRWRRGLQAGAAAAVLALGVWALADGARPAAEAAPVALAPPTPAADAVALTIVRDDPQIVRRLAAAAGPPLVEVLRDDTLVAMLHTTGRQAGVLRVGGQLVVAGLVPDGFQ